MNLFKSSAAKGNEMISSKTNAYFEQQLSIFNGMYFITSTTKTRLEIEHSFGYIHIQFRSRLQCVYTLYAFGFSSHSYCRINWLFVNEFAAHKCMYWLTFLVGSFWFRKCLLLFVFTLSHRWVNLNFRYLHHTKSI